MYIVNFTAKPIYTHAVRPRTTEFGRVTRGEGRVSRAQPCSDIKGLVPALPNFWDPLPMPIQFELQRPNLE